MLKLRYLLLGLGLWFSSGILFSQETSGPVEPAVYRIQCRRLQELEEQLRSLQIKDPGFSMTLEPEAGSGVYRLAVLASSQTQQGIPALLQTFATLLPKTPDAALVSIDNRRPEPPRSAYPTAPAHYLGPVGAMPPNIQTGFVAPNGLPSQNEARDSFTPSNVSLGKVEQTLRSLLGERINEMSPDKFLVSVERGGVKKHCTVDVDRKENRLLIVGDKSLCTQLIELVDAIDQPNPPEGRQRRFVPTAGIRPETVARLCEINRSPKQNTPAGFPLPHRMSNPTFKTIETPPLPEGQAPKVEFRRELGEIREPRRLPEPNGTRHLHPNRNPVIQLVGYQFQGEGLDLGGGGGDAMGSESPNGPNSGGMEVVPDFRYQVLDDLDVVIIDATGAEVARFTDMIRQIEELSKIADPKIEMVPLKHVNCVSLNWVIFQVYIDLFRTKQGTVKIIPLIQPNAMLLVGWGHALEAMKDLIATLDKPVAAENNVLQVIKLKHASAQYALTVLRGAFPIPPAQNSAFAPRVQMFADTRINALIVQAGPNDMKEIERLVNDMDVPDAGPKLQVKTFKLKHTLASSLADVLSNVIQPGTAGTSDRKLPGLELLDEQGKRMIDSGIMSDVKISRDDRTNSVVVTAPQRSMPLIEELIKMLDTPSATAEIKVFQILYGDANSMIKTLQSLIPTQLEGQIGPQLPGSKDEDALVPVRFAVDSRTNSILAAGAPSDLKIVEALLYSLDREDRQTRKQTVYMLKSMQALDVSVAINEYIRSKRTIQNSAPGVVSPYQQIESEVIIIPEHVSNSLIVSATPRYYDEIIELIQEIDKSPPQVVIQVMIGEVSLNNQDELGAEFGIQDSLLFNRSTFDSITQGTRKISRTENGVTTIVEEPIIVNGTANPGWLFNENPSSSLANGYNDTSATQVGTVGSQLLTNFATGRVGAETGFGGMVFSANSDAVSIMIRALQETNRLEILSRPQITAMNNQKAMIHVGQLVPRFQGTQNTSYSSSSNVKDEMVGLMLVVTPSISPEGNVVMLVAAEKSKIGTDSVVVGYSEGKEVRSPAIDRIHTMTMISAADNETVVLGGLISKENQELRRKVPLLGDIPIVGKLFRYEYNKCRRSELLIVMTPRIVRDSGDMDQIKQIEAARMSWCLGNVTKLQGDIGVYNVVAEQPYAGDATVVFPEAVDMESLSEIPDAKTPSKQVPQLAPAAPSSNPPKVPTPVLPKKIDN